MPLYGAKPTIIIGIFGSNGKTSTSNLLSRMFIGTGIAIAAINDKKNASNRKNMTKIEVYKRLINMEINDIIIIEIDDELLKSRELYGVKFDILINCGISEGSYEYSTEGLNKISFLINSSLDSKVLILNTDDDIWKNNLIFNNTYLITYGLGSKSTVTASSIEYGDTLKFFYCLQRSIVSFEGKVIDPMEIPIVINAVGQFNVYNGMAAVTSALFCGIKPENIRAFLDNNLKLPSGVRTVYSSDFKVVDNVCDTLRSFETGFEAIQGVSCERMHLVFNFNPEISLDIKQKIFELIGAWSLTLKIKKISLLNKNLDKQEIELLTLWRESLLKNDVDLLMWEANECSVEQIVDSLGKNDVLTFFCSRHLDELREKLTEILDKRILGILS